MSLKKYKLKDLVDNFSVRARDYGGSEGLEFLGVSNDDGIVKSKSAAEHKGEEYKIIEKGCFAYNPYRINIGSIAYHNEDVKGLISPAYVIFKTKPNSIKDNLLFKFLKSAEGLRQIRFHGRGTVRQALRFEDLCKIEISLPTFEEQEKLISNIEKTEFESNLISSELTHQLDLIKQLRQAFLREAMQGKLVKSTNTKETGQQLLVKIKAEKATLIAEKKLKKEKELAPITKDEIPFEIPEHWAWCRLGEISNIQRGKSPKYSDNGVFKMLNQKCVRWFSINIEHSKAVDEIWFNSIDKELKIKVNDLLVNSTGDGTIGRSGIADIICDNFMFDSHILRVRSFVKIEQKLLCYIINSEYGQSLIESIKGATSTKQTELGVNNLSNFPIPLPPLHEQEQILSKLEELMAFCDGLEQSIKESEGYNEMLLQQVLREALQGNTMINE